MIKKACLLNLIFLLLFSCNSKENSKTYKLKRGSFKAQITETGELQAVNTRLINTPNYKYQYGAAKLLHIVPQGTKVKKGDYIAQLDTSNISRTIVNAKAELLMAESDYDRLLVEQEQSIKQLEAQIESAKATLVLAAMDTQSVQFEPAARKKRSRIEYEIDQINLKQLEKKLKQLYKTQELDKFISLAKIEKHKREIVTATKAIKRFKVYAPANGMVKYRSRGRGRGKSRIGDDFWPGDPIAGLPDLSRMKVASTVVETDIDKVFLNQKVFISLDAYPKQKFAGKIVSISRTCRKKNYDSGVKVFDIIILLDETDPILKPGMTVSCQINIAELQDVLYLPLAFLSNENGKYFVYKDETVGQKRIEVKPGPQNSEAVVIYGKLNEGDILINPKLLGKFDES